MNMYDTKQIYCTRCESCIGEVDYDAKIIHALCGKCANPYPEGDDILYSLSQYPSKLTPKLKQPILAKLPRS